ncbi:MAG: hypothetical protein EXS24_04760 [Pedosphaera sp.]|nr:hypothetical protein [Pedosphaera sp.]
MSTPTNGHGKAAGGWQAYELVIGALLLAVTVWLLASRVDTAEPINAKRAAERAKVGSDARAADAAALAEPQLINTEKKVWRLPIDAAMRLTATEFGADPVAARTRLIKRYDDINPPKK